MKTLPELLRDADPLGYEPRRSGQTRRMCRQRILDAPRTPETVPRRRFVLTTAVGVVAIGITAGSRYWSRVAVDVVAAVRFEARLAEEAPATGLRAVMISGDRTIYLHPEIIVTNSDIARAEVIRVDTTPTFNMAITFTTEGAAEMRRATEGHIGRPLAILLDGAVVMAPVVRSPIATEAAITGAYTRPEAERIVAGIIGR